MTLDDFFTLTEMNNGLTSPSRVGELMVVMQKERDCFVKNASDATRQWSAVARAIAATENKDCLDTFIQLDGLHFISQWLNDAQKFTNDSFVEESVVHLLQVLEQLRLNNENLVGSEIWMIVQKLFVHNSKKVQDSARVLFESWKTNRDNGDVLLSDVEKTKTSTDVGAGKSADPSILGGISFEEKSPELTRDDPDVCTNSDSVYEVKRVDNSKKIINPSSEVDQPLDHLGSPFSPKPTMEPLSHSIGTTTVDTNTEVPNHGKQSQKTESSPERSRLFEKHKLSEGVPSTSSFHAVDGMTHVTEVGSLKNSLAGDINLCNEGLSLGDTMSVDSEEVTHHLSCKSSSSERSWENAKDSENLVSDTEDVEVSAYGIDNHLASTSGFGKTQLGRKSVRAGKKSDEEIDYGIVDPLEVARLVAIEVERDCREDSCSSSEKLLDGNIRQPRSLDSVDVQLSPGEGSPNEVAKSSPMQQESSTGSENLDGAQTNDTGELATSQVAIAAQQEAANIEKSVSNFDLNQDVCSEDRNHFPSSVSIVSASRAAASPGLPSTPLQFEGTLGWKGSAATSAFRAASPRHMPQRNKDPSIGCSSRLGQGHLDFDLNVAENGIADDLHDLQARVFPSRPTGESSAETNSRSEHLELDLNLASEDGSAPSDVWIRRFFPQGKFQDKNHSHSLSASKQPIKDIDLNDQLSFLNGPSNNSYLRKVSPKSEDSVISIMGKRVEVNRHELLSQPLQIPNCQTPELAFDVNSGRTSSFLGMGSVLPFPQPSPVYGYNNIAAPGPGPTMSSSSTVYASGGGLYPYMIDSRGTPVIPQIMGPAASALSQPPFVINMNTSTNGVGPIQGNFYPNPGMLMGSGSKNSAGLGLFLNSTQFRSVDEQPRPNNIQFVSQKRKEADNGWEQYPFKHSTPWRQG